MSEDLEDFGATKHELIEAIHAGANVKDIARLEAALWRLFDRAHALHYFMRVRNELQEKNHHLRKALAFYAEEDWDRCLSDGYSLEEFGETWNFGALARDKGKVARVALKETEE